MKEQFGKAIKLLEDQLLPMRMKIEEETKEELGITAIENEIEEQRARIGKIQTVIKDLTEKLELVYTSKSIYKNGKYIKEESPFSRAVQERLDRIPESTKLNQLKEQQVALLDELMLGELPEQFRDALKKTNEVITRIIPGFKTNLQLMEKNPS